MDSTRGRWGGWTYLHNSAYLAESSDGYVQVYRGVPGDVMGFSYSELVETTDIPVKDLNPSAAQNISQNMRVGSLGEARALVESYRSQRSSADAAGKGTAGESAAAADTEGNPSDETSGEPAR